MSWIPVRFETSPRSVIILKLFVVTLLTWGWWQSHSVKPLAMFRKVFEVSILPYADDTLLLLPFLIPKQEVHSLKDTCLSLSASHSWKKREVQCSIGTRGTRSGASSEWDKNLQHRWTSNLYICKVQHVCIMIRLTNDF